MSVKIIISAAAGAFLGAAFFVGAGQAAAATTSPLMVSPAVIDAEAKPRHILEYDISLKNTGGRTVDVYVFVNDITPDGIEDYTDPQRLDKETSLARWISINRGAIELSSGEERVLPLKIEVNMNAEAGDRHAVVSFAIGPSRAMAAAAMQSQNVPRLFVNVDVSEEIVERAQIIGLKPAKSVFYQAPANLTLSLRNNGNRPLLPRGYVYIYNRRGEEEDRLSANPNPVEIAPGEGAEIALVWPAAKAFGQYRARAEIEYGQVTVRDMQETVYFWVLPRRWLWLVGGGTFLLILVFSLFLYRRTYHRPEPAESVINLKGRR